MEGKGGEIPEEHSSLLRLPFTGPPRSTTIFLYNPAQLSPETWICDILGTSLGARTFLKTKVT